MGKFIQKSKATLLMEASNHNNSPLSIGVRTRAKTLALQRQANAAAGDAGCYLELRSRRLEKAAFVRSKKKNGKRGVPNCGATSRAAFRENERSKRETTPCSLPGDPETIRTPSSTNCRAKSTKENRMAQNSKQQHIPTTHEMNEFFSGPEVEQQKQFIEKYNFDPVNEKPLPGRYEWVKVDP